MSLEFRSTDADELPLLKDFLLGIFAAPKDAPFAQDAHLRWKYFQPRPHSIGSRSFVLAQEESYAAHACAWPFEVLMPDRAGIPGVHPIDWAAGAGVPGAGALLLRRMRTLAPVSCCIGGTEVARKVIVQSGYKESGWMKYYSRPLRPWKQFVTHPRRNYKLPVRLLRNALWSLRTGASAPQGWTAVKTLPEDFPPELQPASTDSLLACGRAAGLFRYLLECPIARYELYIASENNRLAGYFLLSFTPGQARIADAWVLRGGAEDWTALYRLAASVAHAEGSTAEIASAAALPKAQNALEAAGFRSHAALTVMLFDPKKLLPQGVPIHFQMIDNDFSFLHDGSRNYQT